MTPLSSEWRHSWEWRHSTNAICLLKWRHSQQNDATLKNGAILGGRWPGLQSTYEKAKPIFGKPKPSFINCQEVKGEHQLQAAKLRDEILMFTPKNTGCSNHYDLKCSVEFLLQFHQSIKVSLQKLVALNLKIVKYLRRSRSSIRWCDGFTNLNLPNFKSFGTFGWKPDQYLLFHCLSVNH